MTDCLTPEEIHRILISMAVTYRLSNSSPLPSLNAPPPQRYLDAVGGGSACATSLRFAIDE